MSISFMKNPLYEKIPNALHEVLASKQKEVVDSKQAARDFLKSHLGKRNEAVEEMTRAGISLKTCPKYSKFKKTEHFHPQQELLKYAPTRVSRGGLSGQKKRRLGLHLVNPKGKTYATFVPFHVMWQEYATKLLGIRHFISEGWQGALDDTRTTTMQNKFKKIEFFGSCFEITRSTCPSLVGATGIVIKETKNTFTIINQENKVKVIPKLHSEFRFTVDGAQFTILGNHLHQRSVERARHIFKKHCLWL